MKTTQNDKWINEEIDNTMALEVEIYTNKIMRCWKIMIDCGYVDTIYNRIIIQLETKKTLLDKFNFIQHMKGEYNI